MFRSDLAAALSNLGNYYSDVGRPAEALSRAEEAVTVYREMASDNPAYLPDLARALNNLGVHHSTLGRPAEALPPTLEAVTRFRELAADNPAFLPNLAKTLNNLGTHISQLGRPADAVEPTRQAVDLLQHLVGDNPTHTTDLARSLTNLEKRYTEIGDPTAGSAAWEAAIAAGAGGARPLLLLHRSQAQTAGYGLAAAWIADALDHTAVDRGLIAALREEARRHHAADPTGFGVAWTRATGTEPPAWCTLDEDRMKEVDLDRLWQAALAPARSWDDEVLAASGPLITLTEQSREVLARRPGSSPPRSSGRHGDLGPGDPRKATPRGSRLPGTLAVLSGHHPPSCAGWTPTSLPGQPRRSLGRVARAHR
jgi:hypothetical protein